MRLDWGQFCHLGGDTLGNVDGLCLSEVHTRVPDRGHRCCHGGGAAERDGDDPSCLGAGAAAAISSYDNETISKDNIFNLNKGLGTHVF